MEKKYYFRGLGLGMIVTAVIMGIALSGGTKKREMTDEEVIARAKELGMIEDTRLLEPSDEEEKEPEDGETAADTPVKKDVAVKPEAEQKPTVDTPESVQTPTVDTPEPVQTPTSVSPAETKPAQETTPAAGAEKPKADTNEMNKQDDDGESAQVKAEEDETEKPSSAGTEESGGASTPSSGTKSVTIVGGDSSYTIAKKLEAAGVVSSASSYDTYLCEHGYDKKLRAGTFQIPAGATEEQIAKIVTGQ